MMWRSARFLSIRKRTYIRSWLSVGSAGLETSHHQDVFPATHVQSAKHLRAGEVCICEAIFARYLAPAPVRSAKKIKSVPSSRLPQSTQGMLRAQHAAGTVTTHLLGFLNPHLELWEMSSRCLVAASIQPRSPASHPPLQPHSLCLGSSEHLTPQHNHFLQAGMRLQSCAPAQHDLSYSQRCQCQIYPVAADVSDPGVEIAACIP